MSKTINLIQSIVITTLILSCKSETVDNNKYIPLLNMPILVSELNKNGYKTETSKFDDGSILSESIFASDFMEYRIKLYTEKDEFKVSNIRLVARIIEVNKGKIDVSYSFFEDFTKLEIIEKKNKSEVLKEWLKVNFNNDKSNILIENLLFTIYAPTAFVRMLTIEPTENL